MSLPLDTNSITASRPVVHYRALSPTVVASVVMGILSILTVFGSTPPAWLLLAVIPLTGIALGWRAIRQIRKAPDEWTGLQLAWLGIGLSVGMWMAGSCYVLFRQASEVPFGHQWITYEMLQPDPAKPTEPIPRSALDMQDKKVFFQGYMRPRRRQTGIKEFVLCPTKGECPFCTPNPKRTEMIRVMLQGDLETAYTTHLVSVAGRFRVNMDDPSGIPYGLEADYLR